MKRGFVALILLAVLLVACVKFLEVPEERLGDLETTACEEADRAGTCQTRLIEVGIVMPDECCKILGKCCG